MIRFWFKLPVHTTLKPGFAKTDSGDGFGEFDFAEVNLCGQGNRTRIDPALPTHVQKWSKSGRVGG